MKQNCGLPGALLERGIITAIETRGDGMYTSVYCTVSSLDRPGIETPMLPAYGTVGEGDKVLFCLFRDGTGAVFQKIPEEGGE